MTDRWKLDVFSEEAIVQFPDLEEVIFPFEDDRERWIATARLIAAAPELLDALVGLYEHNKNNYGIAGLNQAALEAIEAAVGKPDYTSNPLPDMRQRETGFSLEASND